MGLFSNRIPDLNDPRLRDFGFLVQPISNLYPGRGQSGYTYDLDKIAVTVANRLANMIYRLERTSEDATCCAARWYLDNLVDITIVPRAVSIINPLKTRLRQAIQAHEARMRYECDPEYFGQLVGTSNSERCRILYGPPTSVDDAPRYFPDPFSPWGRLVGWISLHCWHCFSGE
jgi:hypothetical protein